MDVVEQGSGSEFEAYFTTELALKIGMDGFWDNGLSYRNYNRTARDMVRFALFALQNGTWGTRRIVDEDSWHCTQNYF